MIGEFDVFALKLCFLQELAFLIHGESDDARNHQKQGAEKLQSTRQ